MVLNKQFVIVFLICFFFFFANIVLEKKASILLGKEAALFIPSGIMGNLISSNFIIFSVKNILSDSEWDEKCIRMVSTRRSAPTTTILRGY